jgi:hypothetical protein
MGTGKKIAIGCGVLLLAFVVFVGAVLGFVWMATAGPEEAVRNFLAAAAAGDYAKAHDYFAVPLKEKQPLDEFSKGVADAPSLFAITDSTFNDRSIDMSGARLSGSVTLKSGTTVPASFQLVKEGDAWKLIAYHLGSEP